MSLGYCTIPIQICNLYLFCKQKRYKLQIPNKTWNRYTKIEIFENLGLKYNSKKTEDDNFKKLSDKIQKNIQIINLDIDTEDIFTDNQYEEIVCLVKKSDNVYIKTKGKSNKKVEKTNRNIKPLIYVNNEIKMQT